MVRHECGISLCKVRFGERETEPDRESMVGELLRRPGTGVTGGDFY